MTIGRITAAQFRTLLRNAITDRANVYDTGLGAIPAVVINPLAPVLEDQNDRIRNVSLITSLSNELAFAGEFAQDLDDFVYNEGVIRQTSSRAVVNLVFSTPQEPQADIVVQRGFPVGTRPDEATNETLTFITTQEARLIASENARYLNLDTGQWELTVPAIATVAGSAGRAGPNRINRFLRPNLGFQSVTNPEAASGGLDGETNSELIERFLLAILGRRLSTPAGVEKFILDLYPDVSDVVTVYGADPLLTRASTDAGAVDAYLLGDQELSTADSIVYYGVGQLLEISTPPLVTITSVASGATAFTEYDAVAGTGDYTVVYDASGFAGSDRAVEGIEFGASAVATPVVGEVVRIAYTYDSLVRTVQQRMLDDDAYVFGRDLLIRRRADVPIIIEATLVPESGFGFTVVEPLARTSILTFVNDTLKLGDDVEMSDVNAEARLITGIDNLVFTRFARASVSSGVADIAIGRNEKATLADTSLVLNSP